MIAARTKCDQIVFVSDVFLLCFMQRVVIGDVDLNAAILLVGRTIDRQQLLRRLEDGGFGSLSVHMFWVDLLVLLSTETHHKN